MSIRARKNIGVIGLGIIGQRVADNLRERGFRVFVWNRTPRPVPNFVGSPSEVAELCEIIQIFVSDDEALLNLVQRIVRDLGPNHIIIAHCTVSPDTMRAAAEIVGRKGARLLDAPFTGSKTAAEKAQLVYYVGGDEEALQQVRPVLEASSKEIIEMGKVGDATTIKVATNMVTATTVQGAAEAMALVSKAGLSVEKFAQAMRSNGSYSTTLDMKLPMMIAGNYEAHFSTKHMLKDVVIATRLARTLGLEVDATEASRKGLAEEMEQGRGDDDYSSLFRQYFPSGLPRQINEQTLSDEQQPRFAGLDVEATASAKPVVEPVVEPVAEPKPALNLAELNVPAIPSVSAEQLAAHVKPLAPKENGSARPVEPMVAAVAADSPSPIPSPIPAPAPAPSEPKVVEAVAPAVTAKPEEAEKTVEPAGMWGGFWRRTDG
jgi:3-hydroxyisobutyrate dehydrogenase-like beta-hydroxyacid dehydrogenase